MTHSFGSYLREGSGGGGIGVGDYIAWLNTTTKQRNKGRNIMNFRLTVLTTNSNDFGIIGRQTSA